MFLHEGKIKGKRNGNHNFRFHIHTTLEEIRAGYEMLKVCQFFLHPMPEAQVSFLQRNKSPFPQKLTSPRP